MLNKICRSPRVPNEKPRTPSFLADLKGESAVQKRLQNVINESNYDEDDEDTPSMKDLANSLIKHLNK